MTNVSADGRFVSGSRQSHANEPLAGCAKDAGLEGVSSSTLIVIMVLLLGIIGCIRAMTTVGGEEIGWRGFFIWELRKVLPFGGVALVSGVIWGFWHWPIVIYCGGGDPAMQMAAFVVMITAMSAIMAYFTFKSERRRSREELA